MKVRLGILCAGLALPLLAHHSFEAEYDFNKTMKVTGTVTKMEWMNPHAHFYLDVKDASGKVTNWNFELASPNVLKRQGWTRNSMKEGDKVSVSGSAAKDGAKMGNAQSVVLADGKRMGAASSIDDDKK